MKNILKSLLVTFFPKLTRIRNYYNEVYVNPFSDPTSLEKAKNYIERFREIVSDPLNLLIERIPEAGYVDKDNKVILHNGVRVPFSGSGSYYERFSEILVINRGVHEPLEEYCFQQLILSLRNNIGTHTMLELGAYWGHYSLWFSKTLENSHCILVEPDNKNILAGKNNFSDNGMSATFIEAFVSKDDFTVDSFLNDKSNNINELTVLHSDIQGYEEEMLLMSNEALTQGRIKYLLISTHTEKVHDNCVSIITGHGYKVTVDSGPKSHTTSSDGFIFAHRADCHPVISAEKIYGRMDIANTDSKEKLEYLKSLQ